MVMYKTNKYSLVTSSLMLVVIGLLCHIFLYIHSIYAKSICKTFQYGKIIRYNVAVLFDKYPQLKALQNKKLFQPGKMSSYDVRWNEFRMLCTWNCRSL